MVTYGAADAAPWSFYIFLSGGSLN
jgi:hypothetical protein